MKFIQHQNKTYLEVNDYLAGLYEAARLADEDGSFVGECLATTLRGIANKISEGVSQLELRPRS